MITLSNGHSFTFCCASGALAFDGRGWWWDHPLRWLGFIRPKEFTVITKTLTYRPRKGNLTMWAPWRCVRLLGGGDIVNAVGLTNGGLEYWIIHHYPRLRDTGYKAIVSLCPFTPEEAKIMAKRLNIIPKSDGAIVGIEANLSCPNVDHEETYNPIDVLKALKENSSYPIIAKIAFNDLPLSGEMEPWIEAFDAVNTIPWTDLYPNIPSPLESYGLSGGVSGPSIASRARESITILREKGSIKPIITGGGISSLSEVLRREEMGANAFSFGTVFLTNPAVPNRIISQYKPK